MKAGLTMTMRPPSVNQPSGMNAVLVQCDFMSHYIRIDANEVS